METYSQEILTELEYNLVQASSGKRLANYLIDLVVFYVLVFLIAMAIAFFNIQTADNDDTSFSSNGLIDRIIFLLLYGMYMFLVEALFNGKTFGKLITGTRAVKEDGTALTLKSAFLRGISRAVPFDNFSALGNPSYPWHDKWSDTYVIDERKSTLIKNN